MQAQCPEFNSRTHVKEGVYSVRLFDVRKKTFLFPLLSMLVMNPRPWVFKTLLLNHSAVLLKFILVSHNNAVQRSDFKSMLGCGGQQKHGSKARELCAVTVPNIQ